METTERPLVYVAVDLGAGSGRVIAGILEDQRLRLEELHRFPNEGMHLGRHWHWDSTGLFQNILTGLKTAAERYGDAVRSIGIDTWGVDYGLLDDKGELMSLPVMYRDSRTDGRMDEVFTRMPARELYASTGNQFMFYNTLFQLYAEQAEYPERMEQAERVLFMPDLLNKWLCGVSANEATIASTAQLVNPATGDWAWDVIDRLGLPRRIFQNIVQPGAQLGELRSEVTEATGLKASVIAVGCHDTASAYAAVPDRGINSVYLSSGTWSLLGQLREDPLINQESFDLAFTNERAVDGRIRLLKNLCGLWLIQECKRSWDEESPISWEELVEEAAAAPAFVSLVNPDDERFSTPGDMPARLQEACKQSGQAVPEHRGAIARMIFESLALKYRVTYESLETLTGDSPGTLHIVGGGSQNRLLNQFAASALNREVVAGPVEATAAGNILVQLLADEEIDSHDAGVQLIQNSFDVETFQPEDPEKWDAQLERFRSLSAT